MLRSFVGCFPSPRFNGYRRRNVTPTQRKDYAIPPDEFDFRTLLRVLTRHETDFIVVGGLCAVLHGAPVQNL